MNSKIIKWIGVIGYVMGLILLNSCSKNDSGNFDLPDNKKTILGEWQWIRSANGWGDIRIPHTDSIVTLKMNKDSTYSVALNNEVVYSGNFSTKIIPVWDSLLVIQFDQNMSIHLLRIRKMQSLIYFSPDTCSLYDHSTTDGYSHIYYRK
jgi:hypothetical protein